MKRLRYIGDKSIVVNIDGVKRRVLPGEEFTTHQDHLTKFGYFVDVENPTPKFGYKNQVNQIEVNAKTKKKYSPFVGYSKLERTSTPRVSICIVTKGNYNVIKRCLDSIHFHTKYNDYEVLLCDTGTVEQEVFDLYNEYKIKLGQNFKVFKDHEYNFSKNNNFLVKQSTGDVVLFLNNDVFLTYDAVSNMVDYNNLTNIGCLGHRLVFDHDKNIIQHDGQTLYNEDGTWRSLGHHNLMHNKNHVSNESQYVEGVTGACIMMDKSIFEKVNGFDEEYLDVLQDVDLNLKVRALGYDNFCIRDKELIHVDHASRKGADTPNSHIDFEKYKKDWINKGLFQHRHKKVDFSVCIVATKLSEIKKVKKSIHSTEPYELIAYNNRGNYSHSPKALNLLSRMSVAEYQFLTHQDVEFKEKEPFLKFKKLNTLLNDNFGVLGIAGVKLINGQIQGYNYFENRDPVPFHDVDTVDEFAMIIKKSSNLTFDESLVGFHFYGADICLGAMRKGHKNYCIDINIYHHSGGAGNLTYNNNQGWREFKELGFKLYDIYHSDFPNFSTTTTLFNKVNGKGKIKFFIGSVIDEIPNSEVEVIVEL